MDKRNLRKKIVPPRYCIICKKLIPRNTKMGENRIIIKQYLKAKFCCLACKGIWQKQSWRGKNNPNFKHGLTTLNNLLRGSKQYAYWRKCVYKRDNWTCQTCGKKSGIDICAHHIKPFALFPNLIFEVSNGITLCLECHKKTDTYQLSSLKMRKLYDVFK
jgi:hypothetical protein